MILREILSSRGIPDAAGFVGELERQSSAKPFGTQPFPDGQFLVAGDKEIFTNVLGAHLRHDRILPYRLRVAITGYVRKPLVPYMAVPELPTTFFYGAVAVCPSIFRVPEP